MDFSRQRPGLPSKGVLPEEEGGFFAFERRQPAPQARRARPLLLVFGLPVGELLPQGPALLVESQKLRDGNVIGRRGGQRGQDRVDIAPCACSNSARSAGSMAFNRASS